ncbi:Leucine rich repeat-containing protein, partial [Acetitomaculum ruminis DSM 5522]
RKRKEATKKGKKFSLKGYKYTITTASQKNPTVTITGYKNKNLKKISVPETVTYMKVKFKVTAIGNNAFKYQKKATSLVVGKNVQVIGKNAFYGDSKLKTITLKTSSLKKVGAKAFKGIYKKAVIKVPKNKVKSYTKLMKNKGQAKTVKIKK